MPLSLGTPSQLSLFRHIADPKKYSTDKLKQIKSGRENASAFSTAYRSRAGGGGERSERSERSARPAERDDRDARSAAYSNRTKAKSRYDEREAAESDYHAEAEAEAEAEEEVDDRTQEQDDVESVNGNHDYSTQALTNFESEKSQVQQAVRAEEDREKLEFLNELKKYRGQTTREFSLQDSLTDIQFEYDRLKAPENAANVVRIMGIVLQVIVYAVQWGNNKFGPLLKLDNGETSWAMQTGESISNHEYDSVLEKLYRKHWRKGSMSPEAELGMMLIGSAGVFHFQTHVNEKLNKKGSGSNSSGGGSSGGFNLMGMLGPIMGLMGNGGGASKGGSGSMFGSVMESTPPPAPPSKKFDFIAGRSVPPPSYPEASYTTKAPPFSQPAPAVPTPPVQAPSLQAFTDLEQQFARKQQEMMDRLEQVTRRADEQMRMSQARQMDLERQLQQTQMRLHQQQQQVQQQQMQLHQQQQQRAQMQQQQQQQQIVRHSSDTVRAGLDTVRHSSDTEKVSPPPAPPSPEPVRSSNAEDDEAPSEEEEEHKDVKEVMVTEKQKRRTKPVALQIDELSISL